ncbi:MAG: FliM/FliN family flagellar motor switch protein [Kiloniellales bacterium]|nr:FliM/FliN family flagellar motor switch protein [Kiloniellales bacterium]
MDDNRQENLAGGDDANPAGWEDTLAKEDASGSGPMTGMTGQTSPRAKALGRAEAHMPAIHEVELDAYAILGTASMPVSQLLRMGRGAVVELSTGMGDQIDIKANDVLIARGEIIVVQDRIAIEVTEVVKRDQDG